MKYSRLFVYKCVSYNSVCVCVGGGGGGEKGGGLFFFLIFFFLINFNLKKGLKDTRLKIFFCVKLKNKPQKLSPGEKKNLIFQKRVVNCRPKIPLFFFFFFPFFFL